MTIESTLALEEETELVAFAQSLTEQGADYRLRLPVDVGDAGERAVRRALNAIADRITADFREIARLTNTSSSSIARNRFFLDRIGTDASTQADLVDDAVSMLGETVTSMRGVVEGARRSLDIARGTGETSASAALLARDALGELEAGAATVERFDQMISDLWVRAEGIEAAIKAIGDISTKSHLLSINANIEAAHAGTWGRTFAVIAREIGNLANATKAFTAETTTLLEAIRSGVEALRQASREASEMTEHVRASSERVENALNAMGVAASLSREQIEGIEATASQQTEILEGLVTDVEGVAKAATMTLRTVAEAHELQIGDLNSELYAVIGRYRIGTFVDRSLDIGELVATELEAALEAGVRRKRFTLADLVDPVYHEVRGPEIRSLERLFEVGPTGNAFDPPKFATTYDGLIDVELCAILDRFAELNPIFTALCLLDNNTFHIAYSRSARAPITGDPEIDRANNRIKRIFEERTALRCARVGLAGAERLPARVGQHAIEAANIPMHRPDGARPYLVQSYARDTGELFNDLSLALYVDDVHYGALSIAYPAHIV